MNCEINRNTVLQSLSHHIGKNNGIKGKNLVADITWEASTAGDERKLRLVIEELRLEGQHICGTPKTGYFIAVEESDMTETCEFLYNRAMKSLTQISRMKKVSLPDLRGQLGLKI
jgi:hypothetical protein